MCETVRLQGYYSNFTFKSFNSVVEESNRFNLNTPALSLSVTQKDSYVLITTHIFSSISLLHIVVKDMIVVSATFCSFSLRSSCNFQSIFAV